MKLLRKYIQKYDSTYILNIVIDTVSTTVIVRVSSNNKHKTKYQFIQFKNLTLVVSAGCLAGVGWKPGRNAAG